MGWLRDRLGLPFSPLTGVEIWIDRDRFVDPYNLQGSREGLVRLQRQLEVVAQAHGVQISTNVLQALSTFEFSIGLQRFLFFMLSAPVMLLGLYLGAVGVDLGHAERCRELAVLKARGAGPRQDHFMKTCIGIVYDGVRSGPIQALIPSPKELRLHDQLRRLQKRA